MSDPFIGEIRMFAGNYAPRGWALCDGQLLAISQNDALFALLGTTYGGNGSTTFGLPEMRGRIPIHRGTGPGLTPRNLGTRAGSERETLTSNQIGHTHRFGAMNTPATGLSPDANSTLATSVGHSLYVPPGAPVGLNANMINQVGGSQSHNNLMPFLCVNFIIALFGVFPPRN